jgi:hypothetical protein
MKVTDTMIKALKIVRDHKDLRATSFALTMWPESPMHNKVSNTGNGACKGKASWLCGGSYLKKLEKKGLIRCRIMDDKYTLTEIGKEILNKNQ